MKTSFAGSALLLLACMDAASATSLYKPGQYQPLTSDLRMRRVGDLITVMVYENASASSTGKQFPRLDLTRRSTANTSVGREASADLALQGTSKNYNGGVSGSIGTGNSTDARGRTQREGKLLAQITVAVRAVSLNGDLVIGGDQLLEINNERQQIAIEGIVRQQDVSDTNVVLSTRVANAKIRYSGYGDLADKQRPAWWQRFLTLFGV